jgi:hypothetical protein
VPVADPDEPTERLHISLAQVAASSAAAVTAAVLCSFFGVAGTVIGTAAASVLATVGSALYSHSLRRTQARLRRLHQAGAASPPLTEVVKTARQQGRRLVGQVPWRVAGVGAVIVFVVSIGVITAIETGAGESLSALLGVSHSGNRNTSLGSIVGAGGHRHHTSKPKPTPTPTKTSGSPSPSPSASTTSPSSPVSTPPTSTPPTSPATTPPTSSSSSPPPG